MTIFRRATQSFRIKTSRFGGKLAFIVIALFLTALYVVSVLPPTGNCQRVVTGIPLLSRNVVRVSKFIIPAKKICAGKIQPFLLIFIESAWNHIERRKAIRNTWGSPSRTNVWADGTTLAQKVKVIFLFGVRSDKSSQEVILQESQMYGDVVQAEFRDSYRNLTLKTTAAMKWVTEHCSVAKFVIKADDDVFLHVPNWIAVLNAIRHDCFFLGYRQCENEVYRYGSNGISKTIYWHDLYPVHNSGPFYAFPAKMAGDLVNLAERMPYFPIEDAFFSGVLRQILKAEILSKDELFCFNLTWCNFARGDKAGAMGVTSANMYELWRHFRDKSLKQSSVEEIYLTLKLSLQHVFFNKM